MNSKMIEVTVVINGHREGLLAGPSISSMNEALAYAEVHGLRTEVIAILDRADRLTTSVFAEAEIPGLRIIETDYGDPGMARNRGAAEATGRYVTYLDADDLWSFNWIAEAYRFAEEQDGSVIAHSEMNIVFGEINNIWIHADSAAAGFDPSYLTVGNYWDAMCFAPRQTMCEYPFKANDLKAGYGHEDWHFNNHTLLAGIDHRPVPNTIHMKRRRAGSQMVRCSQNDVVPWITDIYRRSFPPNDVAAG